MDLPTHVRFRFRFAPAILAALLPLGCSDTHGPASPFERSAEITAQQAHTAQTEDRMVAPRKLGPDRIFVADASGESIRQVTRGSAPAWSRDGTRIAFERDGAIYLIDSDGSNEVRVGAGTNPAWAPDGRQIAFTSADGISVMNADGSAVRTLLRHDFRDDTIGEWDMGIDNPAWSPDGLFIAFEHHGDGDTEPAQIFIMNADGTNPRRPVQSSIRYAESDPAWSPDGSSLAFWSYGFGVAVVDVRSGALRSVFWDFPRVAYGARPAWSPDGRSLAFNTFRYSMSETVSILIVPSAGGGRQTVISDAHSAAWSPDGTRIAFVSSRGRKTN